VLISRVDESFARYKDAGTGLWTADSVERALREAASKEVMGLQQAEYDAAIKSDVAAIMAATGGKGGFSRGEFLTVCGPMMDRVIASRMARLKHRRARR
jgi:hypothetical protein